LGTIEKALIFVNCDYDYTRNEAMIQSIQQRLFKEACCFIHLF